MPLSSVLGAQSLVRPGVCTSSTRPASPFEGQVIYETDTDLVKSYDGSSWRTVGPYIKAFDLATVLTSQTTTSTTYTDLATAGPSVTLTTGTSAIVILTCSMLNNGGNQTNVSFAVSGATTIAADSDYSIKYTGGTGTGQIGQAHIHKVTTLTAGSNTFTMKYRVSASTGTFENRSIAVIAL